MQREARAFHTTPQTIKRISIRVAARVAIALAASTFAMSLLNAPNIAGAEIATDVEAQSTANQLNNLIETNVAGTDTDASPASVVALVHNTSGTGVHVVELPASSPEAAADLADATDRVPGVIAADVDSIVSASDMVDVTAVTGDPHSSDQWALDAVNATQAWNGSRGAGQIVAVIDTGVDGAHADLAGQVLSGIDFIADGSNNGTGRVDPNGHGTHVSGIIAAVAGNGIGIAGLAPDAKILPIRALNAAGAGYSSDVISGIVWATDHGATIISMSLGGTLPSDAMRSAIDYAVSHNVLVLAAGGNNATYCTAGESAPYPTTGCAYPGAFANTMGVAAVEQNLSHASYSNQGHYIDIAAPGSSILSTWPGGGYAYASGTSMATPYAAAEAALIRAANPSLSVGGVKNVMQNYVTDLGAPGFDDDFGPGMINAFTSVGGAGGFGPSAPASIGYASGDTYVDLAWTNADNAVVYRVFVDSVWFATVSSNSYRRNGLTRGLVFSVQIQSQDSFGRLSALTAALVVQTNAPDPQPMGWVGVGPGADRIDFAFVVGTRSWVSYYRIYMDGELVWETSANSFSLVMSGGAPHTFQISNVDRWGHEGALSAPALAAPLSSSPTSYSKCTAKKGRAYRLCLQGVARSEARSLRWQEANVTNNDDQDAV